MSRWAGFLLVVAILVTNSSAHEPTVVPVAAGSKVRVVIDNRTWEGMKVGSRVPGWFGLQTTDGLVYLPVSSIDQLWLIEDVPEEPVPDPRFTPRPSSRILDAPAGSEAAAGNVYERLWKLDQMHNGLSVSARADDGTWVDPSADIFLDEQGPAGRRDAAPNRLFARVLQEKLSRPTYVAAKALFDNYVAKDNQPEDALGMNPEEDVEVERFLTAILETQVMQLCKSDLEIRVLNRPLGDDEFRDAIRRQWFDLYTNYYRKDCDPSRVRNAKPFTNGFEHVFVGDYEGGGIGGHHFWYKFYLDEQAGNAGSLGHVYDPGSGGDQYPWVATFKMNWTIDGQNKVGAKKGFSVGNSPELLIAWGTMAAYEHEANLRSDRSPMTIEGARLKLVAFMEMEHDCDRGDHLRSLYPEFHGLVGSGGGGPGGGGGGPGGGGGGPGDGGGGPGDDVQTGPLVISRAMINPSGNESGREWVEMKHIGDAASGTIDLTGWTLCDRRDRCQSIGGTIAPGDSMIVVCTRETPSHPQLTNSGGTITVRKEDGSIATQVSYGRTRDGVANTFPLPNP